MRSLLVALFILIVSVSVWAQNGRRAETFVAITMQGKTVSLASLQGKVVLLTFWSSRCPICVSEIPKMNELAASYRRSDVAFLAASTEDENILGSFLRHHTFSFQILPNSFGLMLKYSKLDADGRANIAYPSYYLIDRSGLIQYHDYGWDKAKQIAAAIDNVLSKR